MQALISETIFAPEEQLDRLHARISHRNAIAVPTRRGDRAAVDEMPGIRHPIVLLPRDVEALEFVHAVCFKGRRLNGRVVTELDLRGGADQRQSKRRTEYEW